MNLLSFDGIINDPKRVFIEAYEQAKMYAERLYKRRRTMCEDFYHMRILKEDNGDDLYLKNYFRIWDDKTKRYTYPEFLGLEPIPLLRRLVKEKSKIYKQQPQRLIEGEYLTEYDKLLKRSGWNSISKDVDRFTYLLGDCAVGIFPDTDRKKLRYILRTDYIPLFVVENPLTPVGVIYPTAYEDKDGATVYAYYDELNFRLFDAGGKDVEIEGIETGEHGLGIFPFIFPRHSNPYDSYFQSPRIELAEANKQMNIAKSALNQLMHYQGAKQLVIAGEAVGNMTDFLIGKSKVLTLQKGNSPDSSTPTANVLDLQANFTEHIEAMKYSIELAAWLADVRIKWSVEGGFQSGVSMRLSDVGNIEDRQMTAEIYEEVIERPMYDVAYEYARRKFVDVFDRGYAKEGDLLTTNWLHIDYPETIEEQASRELHERSMNVITPVDMIIQRNPGMKYREAVKQYLWNKRINELGQPKESVDELTSLLEPTDEEINELLEDGVSEVDNES